MYKQLVPLDSTKHRGTACGPLGDFGFAARAQLASVMVNEFVSCAAHYPIVFVEQEGLHRPVALFGFEQEENLFVEPGSGEWDAAYVPAILRRYPFALVRAGEENTFAVCIDEGSDLVGAERGAPLFVDGEPSPALEHAKRFLLELHQFDGITMACSDFFKELGLLAPLKIQARLAGGVRSVSGALAVDERRLNELSDEQFLELRRRGYLIPLYAHLASLSRVNDLVRRKAQRSPAPAVDEAASGDETQAVEEAAGASATSERPTASEGRRGRGKGRSAAVAR